MKRAPLNHRWVPFNTVLDWARHYSTSDFSGDAVAGTIVAIMLVPQAMAYALLAGLPAQIGLYASMLPLLLYAVIGSSQTLAVGPVAIVSLLVANTINNLGVTNAADLAVVAVALALLSGVILMILGIARLGFLVNFVSHSVISGFTSAAALVIGISQLKSLLGLDIPRSSATEMLMHAVSHIADSNLTTFTIGLGAIVVLASWPALMQWVTRPFSETLRTVVTKAAPLVVVLIGTLMVALLRLDTTAAVAIVGEIPSGLPRVGFPTVNWELWQALLPSALLIAFVGFMESVAVAKTLASKRRQKINANQELIALGAANVGASLTGGYPVTGGFSRSVVNFTAGARTPLASIISAGWIFLTVVVLTPLFRFLPQAVLAAVILVAVSSLIDVRAFRNSWRYNKADSVALVVTFITVLGFGVEAGLLSGVTISIALFLFRTSRPHIAIVGRVGQTEHFRNVHRHRVQTDPAILAIRVDESLYFANTRYLEDYVQSAVAEEHAIRHIVFIMSAVNFVDMSALETLEALIDELRDAGVTVHLAEVKGPVMDQFDHSDLLMHLAPGRVFLSTHEAIVALSPISTDISVGHHQNPEG